MKLSVSMDFDGVLSIPSVEEFARELIEDGVDVWIITNRYSDGNNTDLLNVADRLKIPFDNIIYTNRKDKVGFMPLEFYIFHLDDDPYVINNIIENGEPTTPILRDVSINWKEMCRELIEFNLVMAFEGYIVMAMEPTSLEDLLANALEIEDYEGAAILRDKIKLKSNNGVDN
jgi:hypothetical protein